MMRGKRPLYKSASQRAQLGQGGHPGLWYDKFCDQWLGGDGDWLMTVASDGGESPKLKWIHELTGTAGIGDPDDLRTYGDRLVRLVIANDGWIEVFTAASRFVTGLGRSHPVENGFAWHPTLGTPYLPGSAIKGLARAWAREMGESSEADHLLGNGGHVGVVSFLDAVPLNSVKLEAEVMTPHYANWDPGGDGSRLPGDWRSPTPVPFLVTAAGTTLLVGVVPRRPLSEEDRRRVREWLRDALRTAGGGAKTAVGYGRFERDDARAARLRQDVAEQDLAARRLRERERIMATPHGRWQMAVQESTEWDVLQLIRTHLELNPLTDPDERTAFAGAVQGAGYLPAWRRGELVDPATNVGKKKLKQRARLVTAVLSEARLTDQ